MKNNSIIEILSVAEINKELSVLQTRKNEYRPIVESLKPGEGFIVKCSDWKRKSPIASYFKGSFPSCHITVKKRDEHSYLVIKQIKH